MSEPNHRVFPYPEPERIERPVKHQKPAPRENPWTAERIAELKRLWLEKGLSASLIAREFGTTRNAVIAKVHRLQIRRGAPLRTMSRRPRSKAAALADNRLKMRQRVEAGLPELHAPFERPRRNTVESPNPVHFMDREAHQCCYPLPGPENVTHLLVCGNLILEGDRSTVRSQYCEAHGDMCVAGR